MNNFQFSKLALAPVNIGAKNEKMRKTTKLSNTFQKYIGAQLECFIHRHENRIYICIYFRGCLFVYLFIIM